MKIILLTLVLLTVCGCNAPSPRTIAEMSDQEFFAFVKSAEHRKEDAHRLGMFHLVMQQDEESAIPWLRMAADKGFVHSQYTLGYLLVRHGDGERGLWYLALAVGNGDVEAMKMFADVLLQSLDKTDAQTARRLLSRAGGQGDVRALITLAKLERDGIGGLQDSDRARETLSRALQLVEEGSHFETEIQEMLRLLK